MTARRVGTILALLATGAVMSGCWGGWGFGSYYDYGDESYESSNLEVDNGYQAGSMGDIRSYEAAASRHSGNAYGRYTQVRLDSEGSGFWVMSSITISGVDLAELEPGVVYATPTSGVYEEGEPEVSVLGCSGPSYGNYTYDQTADRTEIEVEDLGDGARRVFFRAWFESDGSEQLTEGSFDVRTTG